MKQNYVAPELTVVSIAVENGFIGSGIASSPLDLDFDMFSYGSDEDLNQASSYSSENDWNWGF